MTANCCQHHFSDILSIMRNRRKYLPFLLSSPILFILIVILAVFWSPSQTLTLFNISISLVIIFFILLFSAFFLLGTYIFKNPLRGLFLGSYILSFLILRYFGFTNLFYPILLLLLTVLIDRLTHKSA